MENWKIRDPSLVRAILSFLFAYSREIFFHAANNPRVRGYTWNVYHEIIHERPNTPRMTRENDVYGRSHDSSEEEPSNRKRLQGITRKHNKKGLTDIRV